MAFRRQMHDHIDFVGTQSFQNGCVVANIGLKKAVIRMIFNLAQRRQIARIGQLVEIDDIDLGISSQMATDRRTNEPCAAGNENIHIISSSKNFCISQKRGLPILVGKLDA
jgi:hypothetical protein